MGFPKNNSMMYPARNKNVFNMTSKKTKSTKSLDLPMGTWASDGVVRLNYHFY